MTTQAIKTSGLTPVKILNKLSCYVKEQVENFNPQQMLKSILVPGIAFIVFLLIWGGAASQVQTSLGTLQIGIASCR